MHAATGRRHKPTVTHAPAAEVADSLRRLKHALHSIQFGFGRALPTVTVTVVCRFSRLTTAAPRHTMAIQAPTSIAMGAGCLRLGLRQQSSTFSSSSLFQLF